MGHRWQGRRGRRTQNNESINDVGTMACVNYPRFSPVFLRFSFFPPDWCGPRLHWSVSGISPFESGDTSFQATG